MFAVFSLLYWVVGLLVIQFYADLSVNQAREQQLGDIRRDLSFARSRIESAIYEDIYIADSLATVLMLDPEAVQNNWNSVADRLVRKSTHIRNIGIAPNSILTNVYPLQGNEKAIGLDLRTIPKQYAAVMEAKRTGSVYLDGPISLVQGGKAIIARFPIFLDYPHNQNYWGSASVVLNYQDIFRESGIQILKNADIAIERKDLNGNEVIFYGSPDTFDAPDVIMPIYLPSTQWTLVAKQTDTEVAATKNARTLTYLFGFTGAAILFLSFYALFRAYRLAHNTSLKDELTHLPNRRYFFSYLTRRIKRAPKAGNFALLNIDLNGFKTINDSFGHGVGDKVLKHTAKHIHKAIPSHDFLARVGGDEFLVILNDVKDQEQAQHAITQIERELSRHPLKWKGQPITPSLSIGFAIYQRQSEATEETLLAEADHRMYQHKQQLK